MHSHAAARGATRGRWARLSIRTILALMSLALAMLAGGALRTFANDDIAAGHDFALRVCAACHVVAPDQSFAPIFDPPAPSFVPLAGRPDINDAFLRKFLSSPHGNRGAMGRMPNPQLLDYQIAYFMSLKEAH